MTFYCIIRNKEQETGDYLKEAALNSGCAFSAIHPEEFNYLEPPEFNRGDILYRASTGSEAQILERWLYREELTTFYDATQKNIIMHNRHSPLIYEKAGLPIPRTIQHVTRNRKILRGYVEALGGFPIIVKTYPGSMGIGVMKADSYGALFALVDYLSKKEEVFMLREFISLENKAIYSNRAVVIGDEVVIAYRNESIELDDFRSNCNQQARHRSLINLTAEQKKTLVRAVKVLGLEFGGVDFLVDEKKGNMYILENNFPFNFLPIVQDLLFPIHYRMVEYLRNKSLAPGVVASEITVHQNSVL